MTFPYCLNYYRQENLNLEQFWLNLSVSGVMMYMKLSPKWKEV